MSKSSTTEAGVGRAVFWTRMQLTFQAAWMCFWLGFIPGLLLPVLIWLGLSSAEGIDAAKLEMLSWVRHDDGHYLWEMRDLGGQYRVIEAVTMDGLASVYLTPDEMQMAITSLQPQIQIFLWVLISAVLLSIAGYVLVWVGLHKLGSSSLENKRIRGAKPWVSSKELNALVRKRGAGSYKLVEVALPERAPVAGMLMIGAQRSGKSLAIHDLMQQVFQKKRKCIIYDQNGEFFRAYYRPGKDFFFNPALKGSVPWSIFSELKFEYDADSLAQAFLPPKAGVVHGASAFFEDAARALFSVMLVRLSRYGAVNTADIAKAIFEMPDEELNTLIEKSVASSAMGGDSKGQRQGVISSIAIYLNGLASVQPGNWSIREFLDSEEDARFFILGTEDTRAMFAPLYRLLLTSAFAMIAAKQQVVHEDKYWFFLDEVHTIGDIRLDEQLATLGKFGVSIVAGLQSESQLWGFLGKDRAETIMNCFNTVLTLRANEPTMMERAALRLGKLEYETVNRNQALAVVEERDGAGLVINEQEKWLIMPSEIGNLDPCNGFVKFVGDYPPAKVDYSHWLPRRKGAKAYVDRFAPIQQTPPRDPDFEIERDWEAGSGDALARVSNAFKEAKANQEPPHDGEKATEGASGSGARAKEEDIELQAAAAAIPAVKTLKDVLASSQNKVDPETGEIIQRTITLNMLDHMRGGGQ